MPQPPVIHNQCLPHDNIFFRVNPTLHEIPPVLSADASSGFSGFPAMLKALKLSPQDFSVVLSDLKLHLKSMS